MTITERAPATTDSARTFGTFGFYRYVLACMVVVTHTIPAWSFVGVYAVFAFFIISGYIVSYILHYSYLPLRHGLWKYAANRALRIYPAYWVALALSVALIAHDPDKARDIFPAIGLPNGWLEWLANIITFGMSNPVTGRLVEPSPLPVSWSLGVEMSFWILMPWLLTRRELRKKILFAAIVYALLVLVMSFSHPSQETLAARYFSSFAAALPFCAGLLLFLHKLHGQFSIPRLFGITSIVGFFAFIVTIPYLFTDMYFTCFYIAVIIEACVIAYLSQIDQRTLSARIRKLDNFFGDLAYPIFLLHMATAMLLHLLFPTMILYTYGYSLLVIAVSSAAGRILHQAIEVPINRLKRAIKC